MKKILGFNNDYIWLSNFYNTPILWQGLGFLNVEAAYQASKCTNTNIAKQFQNMSGKDAKSFSKTINIRKDWNNIKFNVMSQLILQKFLTNENLKQQLIQTDNIYIEETNTWNDIYWGVCNGIGENNLGKILMATREYLKILNNYDRNN